MCTTLAVCMGCSGSKQSLPDEPPPEPNQKSGSSADGANAVNVVKQSDVKLTLHSEPSSAQEKQQAAPVRAPHSRLMHSARRVCAAAAATHATAPTSASAASTATATAPLHPCS